MTPEDLINLLHEQGLDDDTVKELLSEALATLDPSPEIEDKHEEEKEEKEKAEKMLGVEL